MKRTLLLITIICVIILLVYFFLNSKEEKKPGSNKREPLFIDDYSSSKINFSPAALVPFNTTQGGPATNNTTKYINVIYTTYTETDVQYTTAGAISYTSYVGIGNTSTNKPAVIVLHGGGGTRSGSGPTDWAKEFASRGYYATSADYGYEGALGPFTNPYQKAAFSNICAHVRYLKKNAAALGINPNWIFIVGGSAGAITTLATSIVAKFIDAINAGTLIDAFFDEPVNLENPTYSSVPTATGTAAGAAALVYSYVNSATPRNFFYNGTLDCTVAYSDYECGSTFGALETYNRMLSYSIAATFVPYLDADHNITPYHDGMMNGGYLQVVGPLQDLYASNTFNTDIGLVRKFAALINA